MRGGLGISSGGVGHAAHFLRRLDRVSDAQVELALTLYRDEALLAEVLRGASLPEAAERVAISLDDPLEGPFVVVTREGRFVTCLGAGMRASGLSVLTRERLDVAASRVQRMRDELERVRRVRESGADGQASLAFCRMQQQGARFAREDAKVLLQMQPLIEKDCIFVMLDLCDSLLDATKRVATYRIATPDRLSQKQREVVLAFGRAAWTIAHLLVLVSSNRVREAFARGEAAAPDHAGIVHGLASLTFEWGTLLHVARALWFVAQGGKAALAAVKADTRSYTLVHRLYRELALASLALRSEKLRAEALKAMTTREREVDTKLKAAREGVAVAWANTLRQVVNAPAQCEALYLLHSRCFAATRAGGGEDPSPEACAAIPDEVARIAWYASPLTLYDPEAKSGHAVSLFGLPAIIGAAPEELFLPSEWAQRLMPRSDLDEVTYWLSKYLEANHYTTRRSPRTIEAKVGRNDLCPCGSGQKHKRCCGR